MSLFHDQFSILPNRQLAFELRLLKRSPDVADLELRGHRASHLLCLRRPRVYFDVTCTENTAAEYPMNKGTQPSINSFCCFSTVALMCRDGTTKELFIPRVILLTIGNSGTVVGRTSRSSIVSNSFFTSSKLPFHASILKTSLLSSVTGFKFQNLG